MSNPTKFSYGLNLSKNAKAKAPQRKAKAVFGGDDSSDEDAPSGRRRADQKNGAPVEEAITELGDDFLAAPAPTDDRRRPTAAGAEARRKPPQRSQPPSHPPLSKHKLNPTQAGSDLSTTLTARKYADEAAALDPSVYDYDASYDAFKAAARKKVPGEGGDADESGGRKPQYMSSLRKMAEVRERDRRIAEDKKMQRERVAEGDEFVDKEKFVTEAYKRQQEENRRLEEEERRREEEEDRKAAATGGMTGFYKQLLDRDEQRQAAIQEAMQGKKETKGSAPEKEEEQDIEQTTAAKAREINAHGGDIAVNDEGEVVDKRQLLRGGLNLSARKKADLQRERERRNREARDRDRDGDRDRDDDRNNRSQGYFAGSKQAMRDRQSRMLAAQYEQALKRTRDEEEEQLKTVEEASKTRKTAADISSAKERYLARKRAEAEAKKLEEA